MSKRPNLMEYASSIRKQGEDWTMCMERAKKELDEKFPKNEKSKKTDKSKKESNPKKTKKRKGTAKRSDYKSTRDFFQARQTRKK